MITKIFAESRKTYGSRRIKFKLAQLEKFISRKLITRLMQAAHLYCKTKRRFKVATNSKHNNPISPNLLQRQFNVSKHDKCWVGDITYIPTSKGWLYLATVKETKQWEKAEKLSLHPLLGAAFTFKDVIYAGIFYDEWGEYIEENSSKGDNKAYDSATEKYDMARGCLGYALEVAKNDKTETHQFKHIQERLKEAERCSGLDYDKGKDWDGLMQKKLQSLIDTSSLNTSPGPA